MVKARGDLVGNKIAGRVTKAASKSTQEPPCKLVTPTQIDKIQYNQ